MSSVIDASGKPRFLNIMFFPAASATSTRTVTSDAADEGLWTATFVTSETSERDFIAPLNDSDASSTSGTASDTSAGDVDSLSCSVASPPAAALDTAGRLVTSGGAEVTPVPVAVATDDGAAPGELESTVGGDVGTPSSSQDWERLAFLSSWQAAETADFAWLDDVVASGEGWDL